LWHRPFFSAVGWRESAYRNDAPSFISRHIHACPPSLLFHLGTMYRDIIDKKPSLSGTASVILDL
jgi:hypothetical protein